MLKLTAHAKFYVAAAIAAALAINRLAAETLHLTLIPAQVSAALPLFLTAFGFAGAAHSALKIHDALAALLAAGKEAASGN